MKKGYTHFENTIIDNIDFEGYNVKHTNTDFAAINEVYKIFISEKGYEIKRGIGERQAFADWLQGLPSVLTVPFYYNEIVENAQKAEVRVKDEEQFCMDYWKNLTNAFYTLKENL